MIQIKKKRKKFALKADLLANRRAACLRAREVSVTSLKKSRKSIPS